MLVGVDEAGRGPLAGVVLACALYLKKKPPFTPKDSKQLSARVRQDYFSWLIDKKNSCFCLGVATVSEIDRLNILNATFLAFERAISGLIVRAPKLKQARYIIDGNIFRSNLAIDYQCLVKADEKISQVSCASIVAKVSRDHLMDLADLAYPDWGFNVHRGYPTLNHREKLKAEPVTPLHRKSFI